MTSTERSLAERHQEYLRRRVEFDAFNIYLARQIDGSPGSAEEDWYDAEWKDSTCHDVDYADWLYKVARGGIDAKVRFGVLYCAAFELRLRGHRVSGDLRLPADRRRLERICTAVSRLTRLRRFTVPDAVNTVSELSADLLRQLDNPVAASDFS